MSNANKNVYPRMDAGHNTGRAAGSGGVEKSNSPSQALSKPLTMRDLRLHHLDYEPNPHAKALADKYAPAIIEMLKRGKHAQAAQNAPKSAQEKYAEVIPAIPDLRANGYQTEPELTEEDMAALLECPL